MMILKKYFCAAFFIFLGAAAVCGQLCGERPTLRSAPSKSKTLDGAEVMLFSYADGDSSFELEYKDKLFDRRAENFCHKLSLEIGFYNKGDRIMPPQSVSLNFRSVSNSYKYALAAARRLKIVADGAVVYDAETERDADIVFPKKSYRESLIAEFDFATFEKFARRKNVTLFLGKTVFGLTAKQLAALRQMSALVERRAGAKELFP